MFNTSDMKQIVSKTHALDKATVGLGGAGYLLLAIVMVSSLPFFVVISVLEAVDLFFK